MEKNEDLFSYKSAPFSNLFIFTCNRYCCQLPDDCFVRGMKLLVATNVFEPVRLQKLILMYIYFFLFDLVIPFHTSESSRGADATANLTDSGHLASFMREGYGYDQGGSSLKEEICT